jgi:hypothetical protein
VTHPHRSDHINLKKGVSRGCIEFAESQCVGLVEVASGVDQDIQPAVALGGQGGVAAKAFFLFNDGPAGARKIFGQAFK